MSVRVRAPFAGEGTAISQLWRELWVIHESFGGYETSKQEGAFEEVAKRIDEEARLRRGEPLLGRHIHLVAEDEGRIVGQVEGWIDRVPATAWGVRPPTTCEVRSLIVLPTARTRNVGRALLEALFASSRMAARDEPIIAAAEVLHHNPARGFYDRLGFRPGAYALRTSSRDASSASEIGAVTARAARPDDALAVTVLDAQFRETRRDQGDPRLGPPRAIDATLIGAVAESIRAATHGSTGPIVLVATDGHGAVRAKALLGVSPLLSPFARSKRAILGLTAFDPSTDARALAAALSRAAGRLSLLRGAKWLEIVDLPRPSSSSYEAFSAAGAKPWSVTVLRDLLVP